MNSRLEYMEQPNGSTVYIDIWSESMSCYTDEDLTKGYRNTFLANVHVSWGWGTCHCPYDIQNKRFWCDDKGIYTYKNQKKPIYYWKSQNIEEDYDGWVKDAKGYHIPLNQPRKLKKNYF